MQCDGEAFVSEGLLVADFLWAWMMGMGMGMGMGINHICVCCFPLQSISFYHTIPYYTIIVIVVVVVIGIVAYITLLHCCYIVVIVVLRRLLLFLCLFLGARGLGWRGDGDICVHMVWVWICV
ncbi:hypothetical protein EJ05DRAFT_290799 [Pseudovirgaria hyperparasitica]|uniref:Transmembrane protein n=1 Tax=Pseudovirgaria hyperparasitica TaxID=470096 RepID=A0A6A6WG68_9PEZI|nr:uncharacterized protein EJ05DRAFT_290799 [Pseudovirgaria hyperparasitica]KAF2760617.1 hypothetical protein EJ05DRAFT_290799 [Pseudovirgaria hyperparasitica]